MNITREQFQMERLERMLKAIGEFDQKMSKWLNELDEINRIISAQPDETIMRLGEKINNVSEVWWISITGYFHVTAPFDGFMPSLDDLVGAITKALEV